MESRDYNFIQFGVDLVEARRENKFFHSRNQILDLRNFIFLIQQNKILK